MSGGKGTIGFVRLMLDGAFVGKGWQGPTLSGCLRGVSAAEALRSPGRGRKCIWQQVLHAMYWKHGVLRAVVADELPSLGLKPANWPRVPVSGRPRAELDRLWRADVARLKGLHGELVGAIERLEESAVWKKATPARRYCRAVYLAGAAAHDAYHTGQIQLIKKMVR